MERVLLSGASGLIGAALLPSLEQAGTEVVRLVRGPAGQVREISWDPMADAGTGLSPAAVSGFDAVIHLAGDAQSCQGAGANRVQTKGVCVRIGDRVLWRPG